MENVNAQQQAVNDIYEYAANLMVNGNKNSHEVINALMEQGLSRDSAAIVVENLQKQISSTKKEGATKDMIYGLLWCVGGIVATAADIGLIFWGAIVFGAIQFFKGLINSQG
jgi:hypothetical protein